MKNKYGPMITSVALALQSYKALIFISKEIELTDEIENLGVAFIQKYNDEFYLEGDLVASYLERIFDTLNIPKEPLVRKLCGEVVLKYLTGDYRMIETITEILMYKQAYEKRTKK